MRKLSLISDSELFEVMKQILTENHFGNSSKMKYLQRVEAECRKRELDIKSIVMEDLSIMLTSSEMIIHGGELAANTNVELLDDSSIRILIDSLHLQNVQEIYCNISLFCKKYNIGSKNVEIIKATGNSMLNAGIENNDYLIIESSCKANNNDIVVANLNGMLFIKRYVCDMNGIQLVSENPVYSPFIISDDDDLIILGVVKFVVKSVYSK